MDVSVEDVIPVALGGLGFVNEAKIHPVATHHTFLPYYIEPDLSHGLRIFIMVPTNKNLSSRELRDHCREVIPPVGETYISQVIDDILIPYRTFPSGDHGSIHLSNRIERAGTVINDVVMPKVGVGDNPFCHKIL